MWAEQGVSCTLYDGELVIDAHQHVWDLTRARYSWLGPDLGSLNRSVEFDELKPALHRCGVDATVLVQAADNDEDTDHMLQVAAAQPQVCAVVGYVPLDRPREAAARLDVLAGDPKFRGVRTLIHTQPDPDWLLRPTVQQGLALLEERGLTFDVVSVLPRHLEHVPILATRHPGLRMVINHLSKPPIGQVGRQPWFDLIAAAARYPNVYAKISGLYPTTGHPWDWSSADLAPFVDMSVQLFGPGRLMFGGDWPICQLNGGYDKVWQHVLTIVNRLDAPDRRAILGQTAMDTYRIPPPTPLAG